MWKKRLLQINTNIFVGMVDDSVSLFCVFVPCLVYRFFASVCVCFCLVFVFEWCPPQVPSVSLYSMSPASQWYVFFGFWVLHFLFELCFWFTPCLAVLALVATLLLSPFVCFCTWLPCFFFFCFIQLWK